jgi:hypothetical protein
MNFKYSACLLACSLALALQPAHAQTALPEAVKVPDGHRVLLETVGVGEITYECRDKANTPGQTEWTFVGPKAVLNDRGGKQVGDYFGPPATWQAKDGSKVTGTQLAVAPADKGALPINWSRPTRPKAKAPCRGSATSSAWPPAAVRAPSVDCTAQNKGARQVVQYQADYVFWTAK